MVFSHQRTTSFYFFDTHKTIRHVIYPFFINMKKRTIFYKASPLEDKNGHIKR